MIWRDYIDHVNPEGRTESDRVAILYRRFVGLVGENLAKHAGFDLEEVEDIAQSVIQGLMDSPAHRANIFKPAYDYLGIGVAAEGDRIATVQLFGKRMGLLQEPLALRQNPGAALSLAVVDRSPKVAAPTRYDYWMPSRGRAASKDLRIKSARVEVDPGQYRLRLYFPKSGRFSIFYGPDIVVE